MTVDPNDRTTEMLDVGTLRVGCEAVLYCWVRGGPDRAGSMRLAYHQIAQYIREAEPGSFVLEFGGSAHPIELFADD